MLFLHLLLLVVYAKNCLSQEEDEEGPYRGQFIGKLHLYHNQVSGKVYAVDEWTLLLVDFNYDGTGDDTFFWAGDSGRPGPQGFIVPDEHGKTNVLERYYNAEIRLSLPNGKRISQIKWFSIYDIASQNTFGDVYIPEDLPAPAPTSIPAFTSPHVSSQPIKILDANTILIPEFRYDGTGEAYFWVGVGPQPSSKGTKIPDEYGYLEPLRRYNGTDVRLSLGSTTVSTLQWISTWDVSSDTSLAHTLLPDHLNVPPASTTHLGFKSSLPNCKQLHRDVQVSWEVFGSQITIQLAAIIDPTEYIAFGISGSRERSQMLGADVAVVHYSDKLQRPLATDYNITELAPCVQVLGAWRGVCRDDKLGYLDSNQVMSGSREGPLTYVTYRRSLQPAEDIDLEWSQDRPIYVVWAVGRLDFEDEPTFHRLYPKSDIVLNLGSAQSTNDCHTFTSPGSVSAPGWDRSVLNDPALRTFRATLGPAGRTRTSADLAWYINGHITPDIYIRRGLTYTIYVSGGNDPHSARLYHPLVVGVEEVGGVERLTDVQQSRLRLLAGVHTTRRGRLTPTAAGPLCLAEHAPNWDRRRDADYPTFRSFNRSLVWKCDTSSPPAQLKLAPNNTWPDVIYYNSFTHRDMGGRIFVVDKFRRGTKSSSDKTIVSIQIVLVSLVTVLFI